MNTCKAALRIAWQHKLYLLIYMVGLGTLMLVMGSSAISSNDGSGSGVDSFQVATPRIAVINTDGGALGDGLRDYLAQTSTIVTLHDDAQSLQDAVARNDVDLIATIPAGYSSRFEEAAANGERPPTINTAVSYTSGKGSLAKIDVDGYFTQLRNTLSSGLRADMTSAVDYTVQQGARSDLRAGITVVQTKSQSGKSLSNGFGMVMKLSVYPLFTALTVCVSLLIGVFNSRETSRRITASPLRSFIFSGQQLLACLLIGLICWVLYSGATLALIAPHNPGFSALNPGEVTLPVITQLVFTLVAIAFGYMLGQFRISTSAANGIAVALGLVLMFTSGAAFDPSVMPEVMVILGKLTPGWWFSVSVDQALGISTASHTGASLSGWLQALGLVAAFGFAFLCVGLAAGRFRTTHPGTMAPAVTQLTELG